LAVLLKGVEGNKSLPPDLPEVLPWLSINCHQTVIQAPQYPGPTTNKREGDGTG
jgi:hypothetical protein